MTRKVYLDIDGVVADLVGYLVDLGFPVPKTYTFEEYDQKDRIYLKNLFDTPKFTLNLKILPKALDAIEFLDKNNLFGGFLTSRTPSEAVISSTKKWLEKNGLGGYKVIFRKDKHEFLKNENALGIVEDNPLIVPDLKRYKINYVLVSYPYNEGIFPRAKDTFEAVSKLLSISDVLV